MFCLQTSLEKQLKYLHNAPVFDTFILLFKLCMYFAQEDEMRNLRRVDVFWAISINFGRGFKKRINIVKYTCMYVLCRIALNGVNLILEKRYY